MGVVRNPGFQTPLWLWNGHWQTVYPALFRTVEGVVYRRERLPTPDGDFLLLDWCEAGPQMDDKPLVILSHGFEGDSHRPYVKGMVKALRGAGFSCLAWNYRSCGGELNLTPGFYHSGATADLDLVIRHAIGTGYRQIALVGFSLGGNLTLKYLGESRLRPKEVAGAVCFSVPLDLEACSLHLDKPVNRIYQQRFLKSLKIKVEEKARAHPAHVDAAKLRYATSVYAFDDLYTGPLHGYKGAGDYYSSCSARYFLSTIDRPTLIVNAANDPMVPEYSLPLKELERLSKVNLWLSSQGGHCGFLQRGAKNGPYWSENVATNFLVDLMK